MHARTARMGARLVLLANVCTIVLSDLSRLATQAAVLAASNSTQAGAAGANQQRPAARYQADEQQQQQQQRRARALSGAASEQTSALVYLQKYGYMQAPANKLETNNLVSEESFSSAVAEFQRFAGLPQTGLADNQTLELMRLPRCGNSDKWRPGEPLQEAGAPLPATVRKSGQLAQRRRRQLSAQLAAHGALRKRRKRYALQGSKWRRQELTYRISQYPSRFSGKRHEVDAQIERAFGIWSQVAPIDFVVKRDGRVHIDIRFASGDHGDGDAFDGPGNTLAHAYFPQYGGDAHFDDQEYWTIDSYAGTNIFQVAAHELGHSLGLGHSNVREALMAPFYQKYKPHFKLHADDVLAIQALYGEKLTGMDAAAVTTTSSPASSTGRFIPSIYKGGGAAAGTTKRPTTTTTSTTSTVSSTTPASSEESDERENGIPDLHGLAPPPPPPPSFNADDPHVLAGGPGSSHGPGVSGGGAERPTSAAYPADLCTDGAIDAITRTEDGSTYAFKGDFYWLLVGEGLAKNYPRRIAADWDGLPGQLDAALTWADGKTFFFKGNKYWRFKNKRRDLGYPKLISAGFAGIPDDLDAALVWSGNGRTYFFKGAEYWRFDSKADPPVSAEYPRPLRVWLGVPNDLNAAFKWENNVTYFFKSNQYYRFNDKEFRVETRGRPAFPRQTSEWWFGCVSSNLAQRALPPAANWRQPPPPPQQLVDATASSWPVALGQAARRPQAPADDWSLLAGLSEDSTRPLGTHISDHRPRAPAPAFSEMEAGGQRGELAPGLLAEGQGEPRTDAPAAAAAAGEFVQNARRPLGNGGLFNPPQASAASSSAASSSSAILSRPGHLLLLACLLLPLTPRPRRRRRPLQPI